MYTWTNYQPFVRTLQTFVSYYRRYTGLPKERIEDMMFYQFWTGGEEAIKYGFIDGLVDDADTKAQPNHPNRKYPRPNKQYLLKYGVTDDE